MLIWAGTDEWRAEAAHVQQGEGRFRAAGVQLGISPVPYRLDYVLETDDAWVTRTLQATADGDGFRRSLLLSRSPSGRWTAQVDAAGAADLPVPGGDTGGLDDAVDCDLGLSPLSNSMPILRHGLHQRAGAVEFAMAWVSVPDLSLHRSVQRYEHLRTTSAGALVRFSSDDFTAELLVDAGGFVVDYPGLARLASAA